MGWNRGKKDEDEKVIERYTANMRARLVSTTRKYLRLLLEEKLKWMNRNERGDV